MPVSTELSPEQLDELRQQATLNELVEQGGIAPRADDPFDPSYLERLTEAEKKRFALAHNYREAKKLQHIINEEDVMPTEVSQASAKEVDSLIKKHFDPKYRLQFMEPDIPDKVEDKDPGQLAEGILVKIFSESGLPFRAELGSDYLDNTGKADIILLIPVGTEKDVIIKIQTKSSPAIEEVKRLQKETPNALVIRLADIPVLEQYVSKDPKDQEDKYKWAKALMKFDATGRPADRRTFVTQYLSRVLGALTATPPDVYPAAKRALKIK